MIFLRDDQARLTLQHYDDVYGREKWPENICIGINSAKVLSQQTECVAPPVHIPLNPSSNYTASVFIVIAPTELPHTTDPRLRQGEDLSVVKCPDLTLDDAPRGCTSDTILEKCDKFHALG